MRSLLEKSNSAVIYLAPIKALCHERFTDWSKKFAELHCFELTGDSDFVAPTELFNSQLILSTPEKWDSMTRKWTDMKNLVSRIGLLLIDEIHLLDGPRGPTLEAVISRMQAIQLQNQGSNSPVSSLRTIALSASAKNIEDIAQWIHAPKDVGVFRFDQSCRPVKLDMHVLGYKEASSPFIFDRNLNYRIHGVISEYSFGRQSLVFCSSRNGCAQAAKQLASDAGRAFVVQGSAKILTECSKSLSNPSLAEFVSVGIGIHHAGLSASDRSSIEHLFLDGHLRVLMATSTLAMGINLPAHLVVVKNTSFYDAESRSYTEHSHSAVEQMLGRAGRPQFDTSATAVIMTENKRKSSWEQMVSGNLVVESHLNACLLEHLNAEVALGTIANVELALQWLKSTFLWVRVAKNPQRYGLAKTSTLAAIEAFMTRVPLISVSIARFTLTGLLRAVQEAFGRTHRARSGEPGREFSGDLANGLGNGSLLRSFQNYGDLRNSQRQEYDCGYPEGAFCC